MLPQTQNEQIGDAVSGTRSDTSDGTGHLETTFDSERNMSHLFQRIWLRSLAYERSAFGICAGTPA